MKLRDINTGSSQKFSFNTRKNLNTKIVDSALEGPVAQPG